MPIRRKYTDEQLREAVRVSGSWKEVKIKLGLSDVSNNASLKNRIKYLRINTSHIDRRDAKHTEDAKNKISKARINYLKSNVNKHNWSVYHKEETKPEKLFREALVNVGISAVQYYTPPENERLFEIDFAIPQAKIAFEINGNQHYYNGKLADYYQDRHDYLVSKGWAVNEIHYSECFNKDKIIKIINEAVDGINISYSSNPDIINYRDHKNNERKEKLEIDKSIKCLYYAVEDILRRDLSLDIYYGFDPPITEIKLYTRSKRGKTTFGSSRPGRYKVEHPTKEELEKLVWEKSTVKIAAELGVSDNAVAMWCKNYGIKKPERGYWRKLSANKIEGTNNCSFCQKTFEYKVGAKNLKRYCSDKCLNAARRRRKKNNKLEQK
jgi:very-short-patch-repair endonuclease